MNAVNITGRIANDFEVKQMQDKRLMIRLSIAVQRSFKNKEGKYDADFINCVVFGTKAEFVERYCKKGMRVGVSGELRVSKYEKNGYTNYSTDVIVSNIEILEKLEKKEVQQESPIYTDELNVDDSFY